jgi:hypothetical protein
VVKAMRRLADDAAVWVVASTPGWHVYRGARKSHWNRCHIINECVVVVHRTDCRCGCKSQLCWLEPAVLVAWLCDNTMR